MAFETTLDQPGFTHIANRMHYIRSSVNSALPKEKTKTKTKEQKKKKKKKKKKKRKQSSLH